MPKNGHQSITISFTIIGCFSFYVFYLLPLVSQKIIIPSIPPLKIQVLNTIMIIHNQFWPWPVIYASDFGDPNRILPMNSGTTSVLSNQNCIVCIWLHTDKLLNRILQILICKFIEEFGYFICLRILKSIYNLFKPLSNRIYLIT